MVAAKRACRIIKDPPTMEFVFCAETTPNSHPKDKVIFGYVLITNQAYANLEQGSEPLTHPKYYKLGTWMKKNQSK